MAVGATAHSRLLLGGLVTVILPDIATTFGVFPNHRHFPRQQPVGRHPRPDYYRSPFHDDCPPENNFFYDFDYFEDENDNLEYLVQEENFDDADFYGVETMVRDSAPSRNAVPHPFCTTSRSPTTYSITPSVAPDFQVNNGQAEASNWVLRQEVKCIWETSAPTAMDGNTMETWAFPTPDLERVQVLLKASQPGSPLHATIDLWHGPENTPCQMAIYCLNEGSGDGDTTATFSAVLQSPRGYNTVAVKNVADMDQSPMMACVEAEMANSKSRSKKNQRDYLHDTSINGHGSRAATFSSGTQAAASVNDDPCKKKRKPLEAVTHRLVESGTPFVVESEAELGDGKNVLTIPIPSHVASVQVLLLTEQLHPLQARIEVVVVSDGTSGENKSASSSIQQICEVYSEDGNSRPLFAVLDSPNVIGRVEFRVINLSSMAFPMQALVEPYGMRKKGEAKEEEGTESWGNNNFNATVVDAEIVP